MIPQVSGVTIDQVNVVQYPTFTYRVTDNQISGNVDGIEAIQQAVYHILSTERYAYPIYSDNRGVEFKKYIGRPFSFLRDTIQKTLRDALLQDDRITAVSVTNVSRTSRDGALIEFKVTSDRGTFGSEVTVNGII